MKASRTGNLRGCQKGAGASLKARKERHEMEEEKKVVVEEGEEGGGGLIHFCARYAPMVRLAAPSAATPNTVLMEGQEQLKSESLCLS